MGLSDDEIVYLLQRVADENQEEKVLQLLQRVAGKDNKEKVVSLVRVLLTRVANKDRTAMMAIWDAYHQHVYKLAMKNLWWYVENADSRQEAAHEIKIQTFEAVWKRPQGYDPEKKATFKTWLLTITKNKVIDYIRANKVPKPPEDIEDLEEVLADPNAIDPAKAVELKSFLDALRDCIQKLPEIMQETYKAFLEDMSTAEIAEELGIPEDTVKSRVRRGNELLKPCVERRAGKWG